MYELNRLKCPRRDSVPGRVPKLLTRSFDLRSNGRCSFVQFLASLFRRAFGFLASGQRNEEGHREGRDKDAS